MCNNFTVIDASFANHNKSEVRSQIITRENNVLKKIVAPLQVKGLFELLNLAFLIRINKMNMNDNRACCVYHVVGITNSDECGNISKYRY